MGTGLAWSKRLEYFDNIFPNLSDVGTAAILAQDLRSQHADVGMRVVPRSFGGRPSGPAGGSASGELFFLKDGTASGPHHRGPFGCERSRGAASAASSAFAVAAAGSRDCAAGSGGRAAGGGNLSRLWK